MIRAESLPIVVVVLDSKFRELGRVPREVRGQPETIGGDVRIKLIASCQVSAQARNHSGPDTPEKLRVCAPILDRRGMLRRFIASDHRFALERNEWKSSLGCL